MLHQPIHPQSTSTIDPALFRQIMVLETGSHYTEFRNGLTPNYNRVVVDIGLGYLGLVGLMALIGQAGGILFGVAAAAVGAIGVGFLVAYLQLFIHEAAHFNLAADRTKNDRLADWLICWQVGTSIAAYRATHFDHHRHLGHDGDTEVSYRHPLSIKFMAEMLTGIHAVRVFMARKAKSPGPSAAGSRAPLLRGLAIHAIIIATTLVLGWWPATLAWIGGIAIAFPFFATVRQLLEHRPSAGMVGEGNSVTRMFGSGPFSSVFGGAGFNRHFLHHLEPQVSYTRFDDLEAYLMGSSVGQYLDARRATYFGTLIELLQEQSV
jgi:fatty acid desaturase